MDRLRGGEVVADFRVPPDWPLTSASWLNLVEVFFAIIDRQAPRRGDFISVERGGQ